MLIRMKPLLPGKYTVEIIGIKKHVSKQNDEGILIKFKIKEGSFVYTTRLSNKAQYLNNKLADVLCGEKHEISYEEAIGKICKFEVEINGDFINLIDVEKVDSIEHDKETSENEDVSMDDIDNVYEDEDSIFEHLQFPDFEDEECADFDEDPICFDDDEDLI